MDRKEILDATFDLEMASTENMIKLSVSDPVAGNVFDSIVMECRKLRLSLSNFSIKDTTIQRKWDRMQKDFDSLQQKYASVLAVPEPLKKVTSSGPDLKVNVPNEGQAELKLSRGGSRKGAGRKSSGKTTKVSITLPDQEWAYIDELIENGHATSRSDYFRSIHYHSRE